MKDLTLSKSNDLQSINSAFVFIPKVLAPSSFRLCSFLKLTFQQFYLPGNLFFGYGE
jgi:hypothetical protein